MIALGDYYRIRITVDWFVYSCFWIMNTWVHDFFGGIKELLSKICMDANFLRGGGNV